jgi:hypothetical protein
MSLTEVMVRLPEDFAQLTPSNIQVVPEYTYTLPVVGLVGNVNGII